MAQIGKISLILPSEIAPRLRELQGKKIGLLKTDQDYCFRVIEAKQIAGEAFVDHDNATTGNVGVIAGDCRTKEDQLGDSLTPLCLLHLDGEIHNKSSRRSDREQEQMSKR